MDPRFIVAAAILALAFAAGLRISGDRWQAKYTKLELAVSTARVEGAEAARRALQEAYQRDLAAAEAEAKEQAELARRARNDAHTVQEQADRLARELAEALKDPDCRAWGDVLSACPTRLHPAFRTP